MATKPVWPTPDGDLQLWAQDLTRLLDEWSTRVQNEQATAPFIPEFKAASLPSPAAYGSTAVREEHSRVIFSSDYETGPALLYSDGTEWRALSSINDAVNYLVFDTVADMLASTLIEEGSAMRTLGYHEAGDGGANIYKAVGPGTGTDDGGSFIDIGVDFQAQGMFPGGYYAAKQWGVRADDTSDDIVPLQAAVDFIKAQGGGKLHLPTGKIAISQALVIASSAFTLIGTGSAGTFFNNDTPQARGTLLRYTGTGSEPAVDLGNATNLYTGIELTAFGIDCKGATNSIGLRLNKGIINSEFHRLSFYNTSKGSEILGTGLITSFNNKYIGCTFEHFDDFGLDILEDGNGTIVDRCKFINSAALGPTPQACIRAGKDELCNSISIEHCSFGAQNVLRHIEIVECEGLNIEGCEIEASGNSTITADWLVKLGDDAAGKSVNGFNIEGCRFLANSKADFAIRFDSVEGGHVSGNRFINTFLGSAYISNFSAACVGIHGNDYNGGNPITSIAGLEFFITTSGQATFGNGVVLKTGPTYNVTNATPDRAYDASAATLGEVRNVLATLISDIQGTKLVQ